MHNSIFRLVIIVEKPHQTRSSRVVVHSVCYLVFLFRPSTVFNYSINIVTSMNMAQTTDSLVGRHRFLPARACGGLRFESPCPRI
jgi:hypothetical protein